MNKKNDVHLAMICAALLASPAAFAEGPDKVFYECGDLKFDVEYAADGSSLKMLPAHVLQKQASEEGIYYAGMGVELRGKSRTEDVEIKPGPRRSFIKCQNIRVGG